MVLQEAPGPSSQHVIVRSYLQAADTWEVNYHHKTPVVLLVVVRFRLRLVRCLPNTESNDHVKLLVVGKTFPYSY